MKIKEGQKYIVRSYDAGVFYGEIAEKDGDEVTMHNARCLWYWSGAASLDQLAVDGVSRPNECKFTKYVDEVILMRVCEIIPCTEDAITSIEAVREWLE